MRLFRVLGGFPIETGTAVPGGGPHGRRSVRLWTDLAAWRVLTRPAGTARTPAERLLRRERRQSEPRAPDQRLRCPAFDAWARVKWPDALCRISGVSVATSFGDLETFLAAPRAKRSGARRTQMPTVIDAAATDRKNTRSAVAAAAGDTLLSICWQMAGDSRRVDVIVCGTRGGPHAAIETFLRRQWCRPAVGVPNHAEGMICGDSRKRRPRPPSAVSGLLAVPNDPAGQGWNSSTA